MKRALVTVMLFSLFSLAFLPGDVCGSACSNTLSPPFIASGVTPNILIILDNSNSMDEDFYGNAVGSYSSASKTVVAKQALKNLVTNLQGKANVGIMTYSLPNDIVAMQIHNAMPFASYNPNSYCANPPQACITYCMNPNDTVSQAACDAACPPNASLGQTFTSFTTQTFTHNDGTHTNFPDLIITHYPATTDTTSARARYCGLAYPKTQMWQYNDPLGFTTTVYYNQTDPFYDWGNDGTLFGYAGSDSPWGIPYSPAENAGNGYVYCPHKQGTSDSWNGYSGGCQYYMFVPTDSDWALGFYNWGQAMPWYWVGPTWFSWSQGSGNPQGYLHVPVGDLSTYCYNSSGVSNGQSCLQTEDCKTAPYTASCSSTQFNNVMNILNPHANDSSNTTGYMSCSAGDKNTCTYIVNASNTPTAGTLNTALSYFNGTYTGQSSPISSICQKNYIIYVTDGLPSTFMNGSQPTPNPAVMSSLMTEVTGQLDILQTNVSRTVSGTSKIFPVKTYVLGVGLTADAKTNLDLMAVHGGTATPSGHAYYADNPSQLVDALDTIVVDLMGRVAAGSAISILSEGQTVNGANMLQGVFYPTKVFGTTTLSWPGYLYNYWYYTSSTVNNIREDTNHNYILDLTSDYVLNFVFDSQTGLSIDRYLDSTGTGSPLSFVDNVGLDSLAPIWEAGKMLFQATAAGRQIYTPGSSATGLVNFNTSNATLTTPGSSPLGTPSTFDPCLDGSSDTQTLQNLINYVRGTDLPGCRSRTVGICSNGTPCSSSSDCSGGSCTQNVWKLGDIVYSTPQVQADYQYCFDGTSFSQACTQNSDCASGSTCQKKESIVYVGANDGMLHAFKTGVLSTAGMVSPHVVQLTGIPTSDMGNELWAFIPQNSLPYLRCLAVPEGCHLYYNDLSPYITTMNQQYCSNAPSQSCTQNSDCASGSTCQTKVLTVLIGGMRLGGATATAYTGNYCFNSSAVSNGQTCSHTSDCTAPYNSSCSAANFCFNSSGAPNGRTCSHTSDCTAPYNSSCSTNYYINAPSDTCSASLSSATTLHAAAALCSNAATCYNPSNCTGLSSYYALDITDAENPKLLWEFSHPFLGFTYSGPAVITKWSNTSNMSGYKYYIMFLSGPTEPVYGNSIQDVQAFVLTLNPANLAIQSVYYRDLGIQRGFGGRLFTNGMDVNGDGYTEFVLFGWANTPTGSTTGWQGGIGKIYTNKTDSTGVNTDAVGALDPSNWTYDLTTYSGVVALPVTSKVAAEQCFDTWYLYSGTGRYFFPQDNYTGAGVNYLMGIPFTCDQYNRCGYCLSSTGLSNRQQCSSNSDCTSAPYDSSCSTSINIQNANACSALQNGNLNQAGWQYNLNAAAVDGTFLQERMITDPTISPGDKVYLTTAEPTSDPCGYGGQSRVWGLNCATGAAITDQSCSGYTVTDPTGTLYLQTSTGAIYQINAASSFSNNPNSAATGNRSTQWFPGIPPENAPPLAQSSTAPPPGGQLMQWIER